MLYLAGCKADGLFKEDDRGAEGLMVRRLQVLLHLCASPLKSNASAFQIDLGWGIGDV
jgi:hypothetical protein